MVAACCLTFSSTLLWKFGFSLQYSMWTIHTTYTHTVTTVHRVGVCPAASVCTQLQDLCSNAYGRRWPAARRVVPLSSHLAGPKISKTKGLHVCLCVLILCRLNDSGFIYLGDSHCCKQFDQFAWGQHIQYSVVKTSLTHSAVFQF